VSTASVVTTVIKSSPHLARMSLSLFWMYLTLDRRVNKTREAFEKQLIKQGMSREDAKRLSACFEELKNNIIDILKQGVTSSLMRP
jgi:predicted secreted protein